jgi:hypothetical protein
MMTAKECVMPLESLACNNCGAPLQVPPSANFATCNHCGAQLAIHRESSVSYTEKIGQIDERTERIARQLAELRYHQALENIDRDWDRQREKYLVSNKNGARREPSVVGGVLTGVVAAIIGLFFLQHLGPWAVLIIVAGIAAAIYSVVKAADYQRAERTYRMRRNRISIADFEEHQTPLSGGSPPGEHAAEHESTSRPGVFGASDDR